MAAVTVADVSDQQTGHEGGQAARVVQLQEQVEVVGQEAVVVQPEAEATAVAAEQAEEVTAVVGVGEQSPAVVGAS